MTKIDLNNLDKSTWETFKFEEIASKVSETVDPNTTDLEVYIGLEHIDAEDIHIRRKGTPDDVSGGKLKCYPGDVIFGKRRAYQRKAAIVDFEGICSAHAFVLRANPEVIDPKLFPFFLHSDQFMHRMVDISVGGLSPTINWGDLKHQEFKIPPKDKQSKLSEFLWEMDSLINSETFLLEKLSNTIHSIIENINEEKSYTRIQIKKVLKKEKIIKSDIGISPYLEIGDINIKNKTIEFKEKKSVGGSIIAKNKSILISKVRPNRGAITLLKNSYSVSNGFAVLNSNEEIILSEFLFHLLAWNNKFLHQMSRLATGSTYPTINDDDITNYHINIPLDKVIQKNTLLKLDKIYNNILEIENKIQSSQSLQKSIINQVF